MARQVVRFSVASADLKMRSATWRCWVGDGNDQSIYLTCRELEGKLHLSLHESGQWHVAFAGELFNSMFEPGQKPKSRLAGQWSKPLPNTAGFIVACRIQTPWFAVSSANVKPLNSISWIPAPASGNMRETRVILTQKQYATGSQVLVVGSLAMKDGSYACIVSREIPHVPPSVLTDTVAPSYFFGKSASDFKSGTTRAIAWGNSTDGAIGFYESPVKVKSKSREP